MLTRLTGGFGAFHCEGRPTRHFACTLPSGHWYQVEGVREISITMVFDFPNSWDYKP